MGWKTHEINLPLRERIEAQIRAEDHGKLPGAKPEQAHGNEPVAAIPRTEGNSVRYGVRIESFRQRLLDPDNLCGKYFVDALRYAGILPEDTAAVMDYRISQTKVPSKDQERTEITIEEL